MTKEKTLKIKGTFHDVLKVAGTYKPKDKAEKPVRKKAVKKGKVQK